MMIEPRDPFERCQLDGLLRLPRAASVNDFRLVEAVDGLGEGVVVAVALAADRGLDTGFAEALRIANRNILCATITMMDQRVAIRLSGVQGLLQRIQNEIRVHASADAPTDDIAGKDVNDEGDINEALPISLLADM